MKRNKCASLGTCFWDLYSLNTSSKATRWSFYSVLLTNKFQQHFNNNKKNRRQLLYDLLGENQRQRKWNEWCLPVLSFLEFKGIYSFAENKYKRWIQAYIFFKFSLKHCGLSPAVGWLTTFNTGNYVRITSRKRGRNDLLKTNLTGFPSSLPLFLLIFFSLSSFAPHSTTQTPGTGYF